MKRICLFLVLVGAFGMLNAQKPDYHGRVKLIHQNIDQYFKSTSPSLYIETTDTAHNEKPYSFLWPICGLIQAVNEMEVLEPQKDYMAPVLRTIEKYYNPTPPAPGYQAYVALAGKDTRYIDDNQWIGIACMDAFNRTKKQKYLDISKVVYLFMMTGYDTISGGGLYWRENDKTSKNACSNGPGILLALQLYKATGATEYLNTGLDLFNWTNKHLLSPRGIYYDAVKMKNMKIDSSYYTYNVGTMLQANVLLYQITKNKAYLNEARKLADAAHAYFYKGNKLPNHYWFNAVLLRGYIELYRIDGNKKQLQFFVDDAERIWKTERDEHNLFGRHKAKSLIDQAAMLEIYARLQQIEGM